MTDPLSALGLGIETIKWIRESVAKKVDTSPKEIEITSKHWDSSSTLVVENKTNKTLFSVQVVCWISPGQKMEFSPHHMKKLQNIGQGRSVDTAFYICQGTSMDEKHDFYIRYRSSDTER